jgi:membrane protein
MAGKRLKRLIKILSGAVSDTEEDFFQLEGHFERIVYFWAHVYRSFIRNRCMIRASALSYTSLLALIPLLAVAISVTSSLLKQEGEDKIYQAIDKFVASVVPPAPESTNAADEDLESASDLAGPADFVAESGPRPAPVLTNTNAPATTNQTVAALAGLAGDKRVVSAQKSAAKSIHEFVKNTQSGKIGAVGMLLLVFVAIRLLANIEATFNDIWGASRGRSWVWRIVLYWTTITLGPIALVGAVGLAGSSQLHTVKDFFQQMPLVGSVVFEFIPVILLWLIFAVVYLLVPNTKVKFSAALVGGIVSGSAWHLNNIFGFLFASRLVTNSRIYGSLALVPVFMVGLYFSWVILLFGAQVAYAFQNRKTYLQEKLLVNINQRGREFVALRIMACLGQHFKNGLRPPTLSQLSNLLNIPSSLLLLVLRILANKQLVTEVSGPETAYMPAKPLDAINAHDILSAIRTGTGQELPLKEEVSQKEIYGEFARIEQAERDAAAALSLQKLVNHLPPPPALLPPEPLPEEDQIMDVETIDDLEMAEPAAKIRPEPPAQSNEDSQLGKQAAETPPPESTPAEKNPPRREVVAPDENREFPL